MKRFLSKEKILATAIATLASSAASANLPDSVKLENQLSNLAKTTVSKTNSSFGSGFILTPNAKSNADSSGLHAQHSSHASHGSHQSHVSHQSHYSSY